MMRYEVRHSEWGEDPYGWQVVLDGKVLDTYEDKSLADAYASYANQKQSTRELQCN